MVTVQVSTLRGKLKALPLGRVVDTFLDYLTVEAGLSPNTIVSCATCPIADWPKTVSAGIWSL
jgi:hypothetical protein